MTVAAVHIDAGSFCTGAVSTGRDAAVAFDTLLATPPTGGLYLSGWWGGFCHFEAGQGKGNSSRVPVIQVTK